MFEIVVDNWETEQVVERRRRKSVAVMMAKILAKTRKLDGSPLYASVAVRNNSGTVFWHDNT